MIGAASQRRQGIERFTNSKINKRRKLKLRRRIRMSY